jgi:hypothetical protein
VRHAKVGAIVVAAAIAGGILVGFAGGAAAGNQHRTHHSKSTAHLEKDPNNPGTRDVGFTG